nr:hypothetical protein [Tanacetum cinerariifolium]
MGDKHLDTILATKSDEVIKYSVEDLVPILSESEGILDTMCDVHLVNNPTPLEAKDHFEIVLNSNDDITSSDDDSLYNENIEYVEASPHNSELVSLEVAEIVILKEEEIEDDNLREKLLNVHLLIANIEALKDNPTSSSEFLTKSSSTSPKYFLEETNTFHNSLPKFENFCFDLEEISSGSTTTHSDISLSEYDSFIFDLSKDQFPPTDRSDSTHEEFADELAYIISPPEYDCFYFRNLHDAAVSRRHVAASYWTAASDVASTSAPVSAGQRRSTPPATGHQRRFTVVFGGQRRRSTLADHGGDRRSTVAVNDGRRWRTTVDCRWTTVDHHRTTGQRWLVGWSTIGSGPVWIGSGPGLGRVWIGSGSGPPRVSHVCPRGIHVDADYHDDVSSSNSSSRHLHSTSYTNHLPSAAATWQLRDLPCGIEIVAHGGLKEVIWYCSSVARCTGEAVRMRGCFGGNIG